MNIKEIEEEFNLRFPKGSSISRSKLWDWFYNKLSDIRRYPMITSVSNLRHDKDSLGFSIDIFIDGELHRRNVDIVIVGEDNDFIVQV